MTLSELAFFAACLLVAFGLTCLLLPIGKMRKRTWDFIIHDTLEDRTHHLRTQAQAVKLILSKPALTLAVRRWHGTDYSETIWLLDHDDTDVTRIVRADLD